MLSRKKKSDGKGKTFAEYLIKKVSEEFNSREEKEKQKMAKEAATEKERFIKWLSELSKDDVGIVGGKGANLAEIYNSGFPVPPAFVITAQAFEYFLEHNKLKEKIQGMIKEIDINDTDELERRAKDIQQIVGGAEMPPELEREITEAYKNLDIDLTGNADPHASGALAILRVGRERCFVAVRSSATTEDLGSASFAGQQETFLNIKGNAELIEAVKRCLASLFTARAVYYREKKGFEHETSLIAVVVQRMINSEESGVIFTINPANNEEEVIIEGVFGLGEGIVSGAIKPDHYVLDKKTLNLKSKDISQKEIIFTRTAAGKSITQPLHEGKQNAQVLNESQLKKLGNYAMRLEEHYKHPQDIEFAIEGGNIYIVQTRPVTTIKGKIQAKEIKGEIILEGLAASPGIASGTVKIVKGLDELSKVKKGDVLVTKMTNPDMVVTMQRAAAIVTDEGGATAHAAIVSREMGIPCVVGTKTATASLKEGQQITVNGFAGKVYKGVQAATERVEIKPIVKTKTRIKVIIDLPAFAERAAETKADGIGLLRLEGIIASAEKHPLQYLRENRMEDYKNLILQGIKKIVQHFPKQYAWIRTSDIRSDEFQHLRGSPKVEVNPMLGMHGIRESLKNPQLLKAELRAVKEASEQGFLIGVMVPQLISIQELKEVKRIFSELNMPASVHLGVMIETPAAVQIINDICKEGIDFISFGTNDLTQYTLAIDRGNENLQGLYDEMNPAVLSQLSQVIKTCKRYNVKTSICGQAGSRPEMAKWLVEHGIDSISANADAAHEVSSIVARVEEEVAAERQRTNHEEAEETPKEGKIKTYEDEDLEESRKIEPTADEVSEAAEEAVHEQLAVYPGDKSEKEQETENKEEVQTEEIMPEEVEISEAEAVNEVGEGAEKTEDIPKQLGEQPNTAADYDGYEEEGLDIF